MSDPMQANRSTLKEFLASIATIKGDLSNITAPPFVLAQQSTTEFPAYWAERPAVFTAPASSEDPAVRALLVLKWFISALKGQQYAGREPDQGIKKPLNAFLGELFLAKWTDEAGETHLVSEQVSHHPPVTACCLWNDRQGVRAEGYTCQEITASLSGTISIKQIGHAILHLDRYDEDYLIPVPDVRVKGVLTGSPYPELAGTYYITSSSGIYSKIDFSGKGLFSGKKNSFHATVYRKDDIQNPLFQAEGQWTGKFTFTDAAGGELETFDSTIKDQTALQVEALDDQDPWESRRAWRGTIEALGHGNMQATADAKSKVEQAQRRLRKEEEQAGRKWAALFFKQDDGDATFDRLAEDIGEHLHADKTVGVWRFDWDKYGTVKKPFRGDLTPLG